MTSSGDQPTRPPTTRPRVVGGAALAFRRVLILAFVVIVAILLRLMLLALTYETTTLQTFRPPASVTGDAASCSVFVVRSQHDFKWFRRDIHQHLVVGESADYGVVLPLDVYWLPSFGKLKATITAEGARIELPPLPGMEQRGAITYNVPAAWCAGGR